MIIFEEVNIRQGGDCLSYRLILTPVEGQVDGYCDVHGAGGFRI
jgi:hypothetical protein